MSVHQIIYTSCMRGINGTNDGQQIFSYDAQFEDLGNDDIKSLFSYQPPALEPGVIMTEEIAATLPQSFVFRRLENGKCALSLSTYLGRDYMGSAGRFGNHLSHIIVADELDFVNYPCEFYDGDLLRRQMEFEEVNNPNPPDFLPAPILEKGYAVDTESVLEFLNVDNRLEIYKNMLYAMLAFEKERKRIVICDEPENIVMWIAALEYAVPLKMALGINFTTYEFDPSLSVSQICGVVERGTRYTPESRGLHFVFDLYQDDCAEFDKEPEFYDFIDTAFSLSFESIQDFHAFLMKGYTYGKADEELYSAYALYSLVSDGISGMTRRRLESALNFADKYAGHSEKVRVAKGILSQCEKLLGVDRHVFLTVMQYVFSLKCVLDQAEQATVKNLIVDRTLGEFLDAQITEDAFVTFYGDIDKMCGQHGIGLATELMQEKNQPKLFAAMKSAVQTWEIAFIIKVVSAYVKECHISIAELDPDKSLGHTYCDIIMAVYSQNPQNTYFAVACILNEFANDSSDLTNMTLNVEKMLLAMSDGGKESESLWEYYGKTMVSKQIDHFSAAYNILVHGERFGQVYMLFKLQVQDAADVVTAQKVFDDHFNKYVKKNETYASQYRIKILEKYYERLGGFDRKQGRGARVELFNLLLSNKVNTEFSDELIFDLLDDVPYKSPSRENSEFIQNVIQYTYGFRKQYITDKLFLLLIGMVVEDAESSRQLQKNVGKLRSLIQGGRGDLTKLSEKSVEEYFAWVLPKACNVCKENDTMNMLYNLFDMSPAMREQFFSKCTGIYLKQCKGDKDLTAFAEYFGFACGHGDAQTRENLGKALCRLNKREMAELDETIQETYEEDGRLIKHWEDMKAMAETTTPLLSNLNNFISEGKKRITLWQRRGN